MLVARVVEERWHVRADDKPLVPGLQCDGMGGFV